MLIGGVAAGAGPGEGCQKSEGKKIHRKREAGREERKAAAASLVTTEKCNTGVPRTTGAGGVRGAIQRGLNLGAYI